jgi:hypothetical protein
MKVGPSEQMGTLVALEGWVSLEQVVADSDPLDGNVLSRGHELVTALLPLLDQTETWKYHPNS